MKKYKLGDICIFNAKTISRTENILIDYLETCNLIKGQITNVQSVCLLDAPSRAQRQVRHHTILYSLVRPNQKHYGILSFPQENLVVSTGFVTIDVKPEYHCTIDPLYLYAMLTQDDMTEHLQTIAEGAVSSYPALLPSDIANLEFDFPTFEIQRATSFFIDNLNRKIELNRAINHNLEAMAKQLYDYWFVQFDFPDENGKPYKSSGGAMAYSEVLKVYIPKGWTYSSLRELTELEDSKRIPLSNAQRAERKGTYPYYGATGIMDYIDDFIFDYDILLLAEDGSTSDSNGFPIVQYVWGEVWVNNHAHIILPKERKHLIYTYFLLKSIPVKMIETGSIQKKISQDNLLRYKALEVPKKLKDLYTEHMAPLWKQRKLAVENIEYLTKLRDELLPLLMNGQVSVNYDLSND